jgi:hypothetical protein
MLLIWLALIAGIIYAAHSGLGKRGYYFGFAFIGLVISLIFTGTFFAAGTVSHPTTGPLTVENVSAFFVCLGLDVLVGPILGACFYKKSAEG